MGYWYENIDLALLVLLAAGIAAFAYMVTHDGGGRPNI